MRHFLISMLIGFTSGTNAQELIPNGSFEDITSCPQGADITKATPWFNPTAATPDLRHSCQGPQTFIPYHGISCVGLSLFETAFPTFDGDFIEVPLQNSLDAGVSYCVRYYTKPKDIPVIALDCINACFSINPVSSPNYNAPSCDFLVFQSTTGAINDTSVWVAITGTYTALGGENYLTIGRFTPIEFCNKIQNSAGPGTSYYLIDSVSVKRCNGVSVSNFQSPQTLNRVFPNPATNELYFQVNKPCNFTIINSLGEVIKTGKTSQQPVDITFLLNGIYFVTLWHEDGDSSTARLVVLH